MSRSCCRFLSVLFLAAFSIGGYAADSSSWRHRVSVSVECDDSALKNQIVSFLGRELRDLGDVDITDTDPHFEVSIVAIAVTLKSGYNAGYAVSVVITSPLGDWTWALSKDLSEATKEAISGVFASHESLEVQRLLVGSVDGLKEQLTEVIADFDAEKLEPQRRLRQSVRERSKN